MVYYGLERARSFDREANGLDKLSFQYVIFGMKDLYKHITEFDGRNKDIAGVFVTSDRAFMKARNKGFRRVFVVPTLVGITAADVIEADGLDISIIDASAAVIKMSVNEAKTANYVDSIKAIGALAKCIKKKDVKGCASILTVYGKSFETVAEDLVDIVQDAKRLADVKKLSQDLRDTRNSLNDLQERYDSVCRELSGIAADSGKEAESIVPVIDSRDKDDEIRSLRTMLSNEQSQNEEKYAQLSEEIKKSAEIASKAEERATAAEAERDNAKAACDSLESQMREQVDAYNALVLKHNELLENLHQCEESLEEATAKVEEYKKSEEDLNANTVIAALKSEIDELSKSNLSMEKISKQMPIIGSKFAISATKIIVLKEIKTAIYLNSLISQMNFILRRVVVGEQNRSFCIVVLDTLIDKFREFKYRKHGFSINKMPVVTDKNDMQVIVTNNFDVSFLKNTLKLNTYDYLIVVDRLKLPESAVKHSSATVFCLIDSYHDIEDFKIRNGNFVIFGDTLKCTPSVSILPDGRMFDKDHDERKFSLYRSKSVEKILEASGVI